MYEIDRYVNWNKVALATIWILYALAVAQEWFQAGIVLPGY